MMSTINAQTVHCAGNLNAPFRRVATDVFEQAENLPEWQQKYWQLGLGSFRGETESVSLNGVQLFRESMNRSVDQIGQAPVKRLVLGIPNNMVGEGYWAGHALEANALLALREGDELTFRTPMTSDISFVTIDVDALCEYANHIEGIHLEEHLSKLRNVTILSTDAAQQFRQFLRLALDHALYDSDTRGHAQLRLDLLDVCLRTVNAQIGQSNAISYSGQRVHRYLVNAVRERVLAHLDQPPTVAELSEELKVSRRTLHNAFSVVLGINVVTYLRIVRLHQARRLLRATANSPGRIRDVAVECGFWHLSLFSHYYRELFGELPSVTGLASGSVLNS